MKLDSVLAGRCHCGAVHYAVADEFRYAANCHCSGCRAATGSAFKAFAGIEREKLEITKGQDDLLLIGEEDGNDTRCGVCGSFLFWWCARARSYMSPWGRWSTFPASARPSTSTSGRRRRGTRSRTTCRSSTSSRTSTPPSGQGVPCHSRRFHFLYSRVYSFQPFISINVGLSNRFRATSLPSASKATTT